MRSKETSDDYRYFPEPDLPPLRVDRHGSIGCGPTMPELPAARRERFRDGPWASRRTTPACSSPIRMRRTCSRRRGGDPSASTKSVANWVTGEYLRLRNAATSDAPVRVEPAELAALVRLVDDGSISRANAKEVLAAHATAGTPVASVIAERGFRQISDTGIVGRAVDEVLAANPNAVADYKAGKVQVIGFLVGQVMKATKGQAEASVVQTLRSRAARRMSLTNVVFWALGARPDGDRLCPRAGSVVALPGVARASRRTSIATRRGEGACGRTTTGRRGRPSRWTEARRAARSVGSSSRRGRASSPSGSCSARESRSSRRPVGVVRQGSDPRSSVSAPPILPCSAAASRSPLAHQLVQEVRDERVAAADRRPR